VNAWSPRRERVLRTKHFKVDLGRSELRMASGWKLACIFKSLWFHVVGGFVDQDSELKFHPLSNWYSQCSYCKTGEMWSRLRVPVTRRAAAFCTVCKRLSIDCRRCHMQESCSSPNATRWTHGLLSWLQRATTIVWSYAAGGGSSTLAGARS